MEKGDGGAAPGIILGVVGKGGGKEKKKKKKKKRFFFFFLFPPQPFPHRREQAVKGG